MVVASDVFTDDPPPVIEILPADAELPDSDGYPMDTIWHRQAMNLLIDVIDHHFDDRDDFCVGGNMFVYFRVEDDLITKFRGPDFLFVWNTDRYKDRKYWKVWDEDGKTPNVIIELNSPSTKEIDFGIKKETYEQVLKVEDYFCFDPDENALVGWQLRDGQYVELMPNDNGWLWCEQLKLWLGTWTGKVRGIENAYPRFYDTSGDLVLIRAEAAEREAARLAERLALLEKQLHQPPRNGHG